MKKAMKLALLLCWGISGIPFALSEPVFLPLGIANANQRQPGGELPISGDFSAAPREAQALEAIREENVRDLFPGYTLYRYESLNDGTLALASYYCLSDDLLKIKRVDFVKGGVVISEVDALPLPLSEGALHRLQTASFDRATDVNGMAGALRDVLDMSRIPVRGKVLQVDLQRDFLVLLVEEDEGNRRVQLVSMASGGDYQVYAATSVLPEGTSLDLFHSSDGEIYLQWDNQRVEAGYARTDENQWRWSWSRVPAEGGSFEYSAVFCGVSMHGPWTEGNRDHLLIGAMKNASLCDADVSLLPKTEDELRNALTHDGWATVDAPASALRLRVAPDANAESLGEFYNGTPLRALGQRGEWTKVSIGLDGLSGWMTTRYLAFGDGMDRVKPAFPSKIYLEELEKQQPAYPARKPEDEKSLEGAIHVVGVVDDELYILLTSLGHIGYVPQEWMWDGNG